MEFKYKIKGLGNIEEAIIDIAPFTLIAGENNSGKTFTTKSLYSILEALNNNYISNELLKLHLKIKVLYELEIRNSPKIDKKFITYFNDIQLLFKELISDIKENCEIKEFYIVELRKGLNFIEDYL